MSNLETGAEHPATQKFGRVAMQTADLPPEDVPHLPPSRRRRQHYGRVVAADEPQHRHSRREPLAHPVARLHRNPPVVP